MEHGSAIEVREPPDLDLLRGLRAGIVGTGFIGRIHARSARLAGARIGGVVASSPERSAAAARELNAERAFDGAAELIASEAIDVVHICTPNYLHVEHALAAIGAGKHVVCEKPVALDATGAAELVAAAREAKVVAAVPLVYRYYPTVREARSRLLAGGAGGVRLLHGGYLQDWLLAPEDDNWRVDPELGGSSRAFADIGSHWCDLVEFVSGHRIARLIARTTIAHPERSRASGGGSFERGASAGDRRTVETEDLVTLLFETDRGASGSAVISQVSAGRKNRLWFEISTGGETIVFDQERPETLGVLRRDATESIPRDLDSLSPEAAAYVTLPGGHPQGYHDCFDAFTAEVYALIAGAAPPQLPPGLEDGVRSARITEAVLESARTSSWTEVVAG